MRDYPVGRDSMDVSLSNGTQPQDKIQVELWYPAATHGGKPDYLFSKSLKAEMVQYLGMPSIAISTKEKSQGLREAEPIAGPWPLIIFSHGFASFSRQNDRQAQALAASGYIVAALSHPGDSLTTEFTDGTVVPIEPTQPALRYLGKKADKQLVLHEMTAVDAHFIDLASADTTDQYFAAMKALEENTIFGLNRASAERRTAALVSFVRQLVAPSTTTTTTHAPVIQQIDITRIALYGHSLGGIVSVAAAEQLQQSGIPIGAAVNMDAPQLLIPTHDSVTLTTPTCFLMGGSTKAGKLKLRGTHLNSIWARNNPHVCELNIEQAAHNNFTDLSWVSVLKWIGILGPVPNKKFGNWLNGFLVAYFNHHLKKQPYSYPLWESGELVGNISNPNSYN